MSKFNVLMPDVHVGYLNDGKGQEITYLQIPQDLNKEQLDSDIENGAKHLAATREYLGKKPSRFTVVNSLDKESGLLAISYIASMYNRMDGLHEYDYEDDNDDFYIDDEENIEYDDFEDDEEYEEYDSDDNGPESWEGESEWDENPWRIPIVSVWQLMADMNSQINPFHMGDMSMGGMGRNKNQLPYWYYTRQESICITLDISNMMGIFGASVNNVMKAIKRYANNRHVYFVIYSSEKDNGKNKARFEFDTEDDDTYLFDAVHQLITEVMLEYSAGCVDVIQDENQIIDYYAGLLEDFVNLYGYKLKEGFNGKIIARKAMDMMNPDKAALLEKIVKYVIKQEPADNILTEADFKILEKLNLIGKGAEKAQKTGKLKLENLIGMENVKDSALGIVKMMKYQKQRAKMGLSGNNYHNVHIMLGAPGTAKTTVAEILGNMMAEEKLLHGNRFISVNGAELKGKYVGHSAPKVKALFDDYDVILIDEAYAVASGRDGENDSFSQEAIAQLIIELEKHGNDRLVIFAGYGGKKVSQKDNRMKEFLNANPGIRSRINSTIYFDSYTPDEMVKIFCQHAKNAEYKVSKSAHRLVRDFFETRYMNNDFGNGREARSLLENSIVEAAIRLSEKEDELTLEDMKELKIQDIKNAIQKMTEASEQQEGRKEAKFGFAV